MILKSEVTKGLVKGFKNIGTLGMELCPFLTIFHISHNSPICNCSKIRVNAFTSIGMYHYFCNCMILSGNPEICVRIRKSSPKSSHFKISYALNSWDRPLGLEFNYIMPFEETFQFPFNFSHRSPLSFNPLNCNVPYFIIWLCPNPRWFYLSRGESCALILEYLYC